MEAAWPRPAIPASGSQGARFTTARSAAPDAPQLLKTRRLNSCSADAVQLSVGASQEKQQLTFSPHFVKQHRQARNVEGIRFRYLFERLEGAITKARAMKLAPVTYRLLNALDEATYLLTAELHKRAAQERRSAIQRGKRSGTDCQG
jgi:hypothetical protein